MVIICFITLYPIWYIIVNSLNEGADDTFWMLQDLAMQLQWVEAPQAPLAQSDAEFDKLFNKFLADSESLGYEKLMTVKQAMIEQNKAKLGLE